MKIDYTGKTIVVTGTAQGIGRRRRVPRRNVPRVRAGFLKLRRAQRLLSFGLPRPEAQPPTPDGPRP